MIEIDDLKFKAGFNAGYLLEEYEPALLKEIFKNITPQTPFISGLHSGQQEYQLYKETLELSKLRTGKDTYREL